MDSRVTSHVSVPLSVAAVVVMADVVADAADRVNATSAEVSVRATGLVHLSHCNLKSFIDGKERLADKRLLWSE